MIPHSSLRFLSAFVLAAFLVGVGLINPLRTGEFATVQPATRTSMADESAQAFDARNLLQPSSPSSAVAPPCIWVWVFGRWILVCL